MLQHIPFQKKQSTSDKPPYSKTKLQSPTHWVAELSPRAVDSELGSNHALGAVSEVTGIAVFVVWGVGELQ